MLSDKKQRTETILQNGFLGSGKISFYSQIPLNNCYDIARLNTAISINVVGQSSRQDCKVTWEIY